MTKKTIFSIIAIIILCLCCTVSFAEDNNSVSLGNEIMRSVDKTGDSFENLVSGNVIEDTSKAVTGGVNNMVEGTDEMMMQNQNYNTVQTTREGTVQNSGMGAMTTTTWMWIILSVAAIIIITAIWYYATQNNG